MTTYQHFSAMGADPIETPCVRACVEGDVKSENLACMRVGDADGVGGLTVVEMVKYTVNG